MRTNVPGGIRIVAVAPNGERLDTGRLAHGEQPEATLSRAGWSVESIASATLLTDGALELAYRVTQESGISALVEDVPRDPGIAPDEAGEGYQRVAAYAAVTSSRGVLLTQFNAQTRAAGEWGLPGGGLEEGEDPVHGVHREVWEETGQRIELGTLAAIQSSHWIGRAPSGGVEDFHAVRIVYRATCRAPTDIVIHDIGGTTSDARWVPLEQIRALPLARSWAELEALVELPGDAP